MEYFSDIENGKKPQSVTEMPHSFWCALVSKIEQYFTTEEEYNYRKNYNKYELEHFMTQLVGEVPNAPSPLKTKDDCGKPYTPERVVVMDIIQFWHKYSNSYQQGQLFKEINILFERNELAFKLLENGDIERLINPVLADNIKSNPYNTGDKELDNYLDNAVAKFLHHDIKTRKEALKSLWGAFERIKTILLQHNKPKSVEKLIEKSSDCQEMRKYLDNEAKELTKIGNNFQIRHSEMNQTTINEEKHIDYLFHRMFSLMWLWLKSLDMINNSEKNDDDDIPF